VRETDGVIGTSFIQRVTLWVCLVFLTLVGSAQASHVCGLGNLESSSHRNVSVDQMISGTDGICLICVASQPASRSVSTTSCNPDLSVAETLVPLDFSVLFTEKQFTLWIRPPPSR
jgi:hypothetical protein